MAPLTCVNFWLLGFFISTLLQKADACPRQWLKYQGNCYGFFQKKLSWHEAEIDCQSYGRNTSLASILSWQEALIVSEHISAYMTEAGVDVWIGLHDINHNGNWKWSDGSAYNYRKWLRGEPNNLWKSESCVALRALAAYRRWIDAVCKKAKAYICKHEL
ncbi:C-type lection lectoxin-Enh3-like [Hemicordylus capensis]|uniref:C-type lection lectoxin-Enh3-like n=1 Tax=Hemicordylus capensis TaxID=884348 RepID=UPI002302176F|nr:C-type lection lectoxin-Enh3-like [Hemicordylus capensis]